MFEPHQKSQDNRKMDEFKFSLDLFDLLMQTKQKSDNSKYKIYKDIFPFLQVQGVWLTPQHSVALPPVITDHYIVRCDVMCAV